MAHLGDVLRFADTCGAIRPAARFLVSGLGFPPFLVGYLQRKKFEDSVTILCLYTWCLTGLLMHYSRQKARKPETAPSLEIAIGRPT
jgi:hypothetical protein